jgi:hypothetical protein
MKLLQIIVENFPGFRDEAEYLGQTGIFFFKKKKSEEDFIAWGFI